MGSYLVWPDYLILVSFLVISLGIGVYHSLTGGRQRTTAEFIMADRRLKVLPTTISLLVSFVSAISLLGMSAEMYCYGTQFLVNIVFVVIMFLTITERIIIPWLYPLKLVSAYEYLERRYQSKSVRMFGASLGIISGILYMGVCLYAPSAALESVTGLPLALSIPVMSCVAVTYTALGGMRAVIWTDVFQFVVMIGGLLAIIIKGLIAVGGVSNVIRLTTEEGRLELANISPDPRERHTIWGLLIGLTITWTNGYGLSQASIQRYSAVDRLYKARIAALLNIPPMILMMTISCCMGLIILAFYSTVKCDPIASGKISNSNQLLPFFVADIFSDSPGFGGLFLSTLYGGSLSSISSSLSGGAANFWEDILEWKLSRLPENRKALINRFLVVLLGALATVIAFISNYISGPVTQMATSMIGSVAGPLMGVFVIGGITKVVHWKGALFGGIIGLTCSLWVTIGSHTVTRKDYSLPPLSTDGCRATNFTSFDYRQSVNLQSMMAKDGNNSLSSYLTLSDDAEFHEDSWGFRDLYAISYVWYAPFGAIITSTAAVILSLLTRDRELENIDDSLFIRFRNLFECSCREKSKGGMILTTDGVWKQDNERDDEDIVDKINSNYFGEDEKGQFRPTDDSDTLMKISTHL